MKKIFALILTLVMVLSFAACGTDNKNDADNSGTNLDEIAIADIVTQTASGSDIEFFSFMTETVDSATAAYLIGTDVIDTAFDEAVAHVPMMNTNPFTMIVFRTADEASAEALASELKSEANLRKLVCVEAETVETVANGKTVLFIMGMQIEVDAVLTAFNNL